MSLLNPLYLFPRPVLSLLPSSLFGSPISFLPNSLLCLLHTFSSGFLLRPHLEVFLSPFRFLLKPLLLLHHSLLSKTPLRPLVRPLPRISVSSARKPLQLPSLTLPRSVCFLHPFLVSIPDPFLVSFPVSLPDFYPSSFTFTQPLPCTVPTPISAHVPAPSSLLHPLLPLCKQKTSSNFWFIVNPRSTPTTHPWLRLTLDPFVRALTYSDYRLIY